MQLSRRVKWIGGAGIGAVVLVVVAAIVVYYAFIRSDPPPSLTLQSVATTTAVAGGAAPTTTAHASSSSSDESATTSNVDGTWTATSASQVGYRVTEDLVGGIANNTAVGRTNALAGTITVQGTKATAVALTADLTKLKSDSSRRDGQVQGRILETSRFPTATFTLTTPIDFGSIPQVNAELKTKATGDFTIHGVTRRVTFDVTAQLVSATEIRVLGSVPIKWSDYQISSPSFAGIADVRDNGTMEFLVVATR
jgi:polyisoprenoid-binding protein YceI